MWSELDQMGMSKFAAIATFLVVLISEKDICWIGSNWVGIYSGVSDQYSDVRRSYCIPIEACC